MTEEATTAKQRKYLIGEHIAPTAGDESQFVHGGLRFIDATFATRPEQALTIAAERLAENEEGRQRLAKGIRLVAVAERSLTPKTVKAEVKTQLSID